MKRLWLKLKNRKGFSLVELMVVVAIIGILAVIGIPQYQKFMSKARQAEAKTHLNTIFQGETSFFTEYNNYTTNLNAIGAAAVGTNLRYNAGFTITACTAYGAPVPIGVTTTNDMVSISAGATYFYAITDIAAASTACNDTVGALAYTAAAWGNPTNTATANNNNDAFTINQVRALTQISVGL